MIKTWNLIDHLEPRRLLAYPVPFGSEFYDSASRVVSMPDGGVVVAGMFTTTADFDPTSGRALRTAQPDRADMFVARYSSSGALTWVQQFASDAGDIEVDKEIDTAIDPERAGPFDLGVGIQPEQVGIYATGLVNDSAGNLYITGAFRGSVDFDPTSGKRVLRSLGSRSYINTFLLKLTSSGRLSFVRQLTGDFTNVANDIARDSAGNIYLTGYFTRSANFNLTGGKFNLLTRGREDLFVAKYDPVGRLIWVSNASTDEADRVRRSAGFGIAVDSNANVFVTGSFAGKTFFVPSQRSGPTTLTPVRKADTFVARYAANGALTWVKGFGGKGYESGISIALSPSGQNVYVGSYFQGTVDVDPGPAVQNVEETPEEPGDSPERTDLLLSNFNAANGAFVFGRPLVAGTGYETLGQLKTDSAGNVYATGGFYGTADFDPTSGTFSMTSTLGVEDFDDPNDGDRDNSYDVYLSKLDADGDILFATKFGAASDDYGTSLSLNSSGQPIVAGQFRGTYFFPNTSKKLRPIGAQDGFVAMFDTDGDLL